MHEIFVKFSMLGVSWSSFRRLFSALVKLSGVITRISDRQNADNPADNLSLKL